MLTARSLKKLQEILVDGDTDIEARAWGGERQTFIRIVIIGGVLTDRSRVKIPFVNAGGHARVVTGENNLIWVIVGTTHPQSRHL